MVLPPRVDWKWLARASCARFADERSHAAHERRGNESAVVRDGERLRGLVGRGRVCAFARERSTDGSESRRDRRMVERRADRGCLSAPRVGLEGTREAALRRADELTHVDASLCPQSAVRDLAGRTEAGNGRIRSAEIGGRRDRPRQRNDHPEGAEDGKNSFRKVRHAVPRLMVRFRLALRRARTETHFRCQQLSCPDDPLSGSPHAFGSIAPRARSLGTACLAK